MMVLIVILLWFHSLRFSNSLQQPGCQSSTVRTCPTPSRRDLLVSCAAVAGLGGIPPLLPTYAEDGRRLTYTTLENGVQIADIYIPPTKESSSEVVQATSKINLHLTGRLLGKNGWIFENSQEEQDPYRLVLGTGQVVPGLEAGLLGMRPGGRRRIVVPSKVGYLDKTLEPIPRDFGNRQRLYTTVMNSVRVDRERSQLGSDLAGMVVFDVELLRIR